MIFKIWLTIGVLILMIIAFATIAGDLTARKIIVDTVKYILWLLTILFFIMTIVNVWAY